MSYLTLLATFLMALHVAHCDILLTANLDDVSAIAQKFATSPVVEQIRRIWRRAASAFNQQLARTRERSTYQRRWNNNGPDVVKDKELTELAKNISSYLLTLRRFFKDLN